MADQVGPTEVKVVADTPVMFADGVFNQTFAPGIAKFTLFRTDLGPQTPPEPVAVKVAQIVMPADGFAALVAFFEARLEIMIDEGIISRETLNKTRAFFQNETEKWRRERTEAQKAGNWQPPA
jgi:hypothetical protein